MKKIIGVPEKIKYNVIRLLQLYRFYADDTLNLFFTLLPAN